MLKKWYFAANYNALQNGFDQIQVAVLSCSKVSTLTRHCLVDASAFDNESFSSHLSWLKENGVQLIRHESELFPAMLAAHGESVKIFSGHWLRCDIPIIEHHDTHVLYTDIDVIFRADPAKINKMPAFIAAAPEHEQSNTDYFNSGVMILNIPALRDDRENLKNDVLLHASNRAGHDDQGALNNTYRNKWELLSNSWNWKPYWGINEDAGIVHFVGPKPNLARIILSGDGAKFGEPYVSMVKGCPEGYRHYIAEFDEFLSKA